MGGLQTLNNSHMKPMLESVDLKLAYKRAEKLNFIPIVKWK